MCSCFTTYLKTLNIKHKPILTCQKKTWTTGESQSSKSGMKEPGSVLLRHTGGKRAGTKAFQNSYYFSFRKTHVSLVSAANHQVKKKESYRSAKVVDTLDGSLIQS